MTSPHPSGPPSLASLQARIRNVASQRGTQFRRVQRMIANTVVGQMLPDGVVKGGTAMSFRVGETASRYTPDFDASRSRHMAVDDYVERLRDHLERGWSGFTGTVRVQTPRPVDGVTHGYVMRPAQIRLAFRDRHWLTVDFELGHDEVGSTTTPDLVIADDIVDVFAMIGLEKPRPMPVMRVEHQVAQKLHACTYVPPMTGRNDRAHDRVDLQILAHNASIDVVELCAIGRRLFAARGAQQWPPTVIALDGWDAIYAEAADGLEVLPTVTEAVAWANGLIARGS